MLHISIEKSTLVSKGQPWVFHGRAWTVPWAATACHGRHPLVNFSSVKLPDMRLEPPTVLLDRYRTRKNLITCNDVPSRFEPPRGMGSQDSDHQTVNEESQNTPRPSGNFITSLLGDQSASFTLDTQLLETYSTEVELLKEEVKDMLVEYNFGSGKPEEKMVLIDTLECLRERD